jgi:hypothetical protein
MRNKTTQSSSLTRSVEEAMPWNKSSKNGAYDMLVAQTDIITKITGIIMPKSIDTLENELGGAFTILKSTHFTDRQCYGFLASVIPKDKYRIVINSPAWVYTAPVNPGAYASMALAAGVSGTAQTDCRATQGRADGVRQLSWLVRSRKGATALRHW